uniref:Uncharacterized protein n=1 Tax=Arundo donax TaxID=35708 RepID=A0A0A9DY62_ARUDO
MVQEKSRGSFPAASRRSAISLARSKLNTP